MTAGSCPFDINGIRDYLVVSGYKSSSLKIPSSFTPALRLPRVGALGDLSLGRLGASGGSLSDLVLGLLGLLLDLSGSLLDRGGVGSNADNAEDEAEDGEEDSGNAASNLGNELDGLNGVALGDGQEQVKLLSDVGLGVIQELEVVGRSGLVLLLGSLGLLKGLLNGVLLEESLLGELAGILNGVTNVDVVEKDILLHGPDLVADGTNGLKVGGVLVLEVVGVLDLAGSPDALVGRVVNVRSRPLALVVGVLNHGLGPGATARNISALGVGDSGGDPVTILLIIPILGLLGLGVGDGEGLIDEPVSRLSGILIDNLVRGILIPVIGLLGIGVLNTGLINPVLGLLVLGVINLLGRVDRRSKVLEEAALLDLLAVDANGVGVVGVDCEGVELSSLDNLGRGRGREMLLLVLPSLGVLVVENEVHLVGVAALVGTEHDHVWGRVGELILVESLVIPEELHISTAAFEAVCSRTLARLSDSVQVGVVKRTLKLDLILNDEGLALGVDLLGEFRRDGVVGSSVLDNKTLVTLHALVDSGLLDGPLADVGPFFLRALGILLGVGRLPPLLPVVGELLEEWGLELGRLWKSVVSKQSM